MISRVGVSASTVAWRRSSSRSNVASWCTTKSTSSSGRVRWSASRRPGPGSTPTSRCPGASDRGPADRSSVQYPTRTSFTGRSQAWSTAASESPRASGGPQPRRRPEHGETVSATTITGFRSSRASWGSSSDIRPSRTTRSSSAAMSTGVAAAVAEQDAGRRRVPDQPGGVGVAHRRHLIGAVAEQFGDRPAQTEGHDRAEQRVLLGAQDDMDPERRHPLHHELAHRATSSRFAASDR